MVAASTKDEKMALESLNMVMSDEFDDLPEINFPFNIVFYYEDENGNENDCCKIYIQFIANKIQQKINQHNSAGDKPGSRLV